MNIRITARWSRICCLEKCSILYVAKSSLLSINVSYTEDCKLLEEDAVSICNWFPASWRHYALWNVRKQLPSDMTSYPTRKSLQPRHCENLSTDVSCISHCLALIKCVTYALAMLNCPKNNNRKLTFLFIVLILVRIAQCSKSSPPCVWLCALK